MKPAPFEYANPRTRDEAINLLARHGEEAKILAGGQTLVPILNFRLGAPSLIVDINNIPDLDFITLGPDGLALGALVTWHDIETSADVARANPLLAEAVKHIAHYQIRNRGTWAGSSAHADPAAEFPAVAVACGAQFDVLSVRGQRSVDAEEFFLGPLTTVLEADEMLVGVRFPPWRAGENWAFEEFAFRSGDFAVAGVIALAQPDEFRKNFKIICFGVGDGPVRLRGAEAILAEGCCSESMLKKASRQAASEVNAHDDIHASADYRRALVEVLAYSTLSRAARLESLR